MVALFLLTNTVKAQSGVTDCQTDPATKNPICPPVGKIRVQVPIPGISEVCQYTDKNDVVMGTDGKLKEVVKMCYWVDSLPFYVQKFYNFSIGIIAIIAVLMIMIGGLRWIFAAGNVGSVSEAKSTIYAAITGLVLALTSYVILYNINPRLVNLSLPGVTPVKRIEQQNFWCAQYFYPTPIAGITVSGLNSTSVSGDKAGDCGATYKVEVQAGQNVAITSPTCYGNICTEPGTSCLNMSGSPLCLNPKILCEAARNNCDVFNIDDVTKGTIMNTCRQRRVDGYTDGNCKWDVRWPLMNLVFSVTDYGLTLDYQRVNCSAGPVCSNDSHCSDDQYANQTADNICVLSISKEVVVCKASCAINEQPQNCADYNTQTGNFKNTSSGVCNQQCCAGVFLRERKVI